MSEFCIYRIPGKNGEVSVAIGNHPPVQEQEVSTCQILTEKEGSDSDYINPEMGDQTCPISPLCKKGLE